MTARDDQFLCRSVLRQTGRDPVWVGYWLRRHRMHERIGPTRLAARLGLDRHGMALLSLCRTPREDHLREDLEVICRRTGADEVALAGILRQEQALARWADSPPQPGGWLMAASDAEGASAEGDDTGADREPEPPHDPGTDRPAGG
jgi:hypothetical protein